MDRQVQLYVSTTSYQNITTSVVNTFYNNVTANGGVCESGQCMIDYLNSLGGIYGNLASAERLELFEDEQINVTSTVQNVQDISKTFTDFSQSFTIPANDHNNGILQHFYQSDVNALIDYNIRLDSFIEIDFTFFRRGKLQVEKANLKNGRPESYSVTFYGDGRTLKDYFGEDLLSNLDYSSLTHAFTSAEVKARIENSTNTYDVKYPLITSNRIWEYQSTQANVPLPNWLTSTNTNNDIHTTSGSINKNELFPAVRVKTIFDFIQTKYGVTFNGTFLDDDRFTKLFLWFKGSQTLQTASNSYEPVIDTLTPTYTTYNLEPYVNVTNNDILITYQNGIASHFLTLNVISTTTTEDYIIDVYQNGNLINSVQGSGLASYGLTSIANVVGLNEIYTFRIRTLGTNTLDLELEYLVSYLSGGVFYTDQVNIVYDSLSVLQFINLSSNAPQMKVADFFSGILKVFNLVCIGVDENTYDIATLDDWYGQGAIIDISEYTDIQSIDVARMPLYKKITFKYQNSDCFINKYFAQTYSRNYGDTTYQYNYDGGEYTIELPFENLMQTKFNGTQELQLGYSLNSEYAPYLPKPVLLYQYDNKTTNFKFTNDIGSHATITNYTPFGQDLRYNNTDLTLNFAADTSTLLLVPIQNTLFAQYHFSYLYNLYNLKQRLINVKTIMPVSILTNLRLNDRVMIRDKRYIINDMKSNLTNGEVDLSLYLDFRPMINKVPFYQTPTSGGSIATAINLPNGGGSAVLTPSSPDLILSATNLTTSQIVEMTTPPASVGDVFSVEVAYTSATGIRTNETINIVVQ
jgi:hypothetical protein